VFAAACAVAGRVLVPLQPSVAGVILLRPPGALVNARWIAADPNHPGTVYAATYDPASTTLPYPASSLFRSVDGGTTWTEVGQDLPWAGHFVGLAVGADSTLYVMSSDDWRMRRSTDGGQTWEPTSIAFGEGLIADPSNAGVLYRRDWGVARSTDGGTSWVESGPDLGPPLPGESGPSVSALALDPSDPATLFCGRLEKGIYRSRDGGATWASLDLGAEPSAVLAIAVDPTDSAVVYAGTAEDGLFRSSDGGDHWAPVDTGSANRQVFAVAVDAVGAVYAGIYDCCVLVSTDGGATWSDAAPDLHEIFVTTLVADPTTPGVVYVGTLQ